MVSLWVATAYLIKKGKYRFGSLLTAIPATFMSAVSMTYILTAQEGFRLATRIAYPIGGAFAGALFVLYIVLWTRYYKKNKFSIELNETNKEEGEGKENLSEKQS